MMKWIMSNPLYMGIALVVLIAFIGGTVAYCERKDIREEENLINQGVVQERDASKSEVINDVAEAQDAVRNPTSDDLNRVCSKYDRNC